MPAGDGTSSGIFVAAIGATGLILTAVVTVYGRRRSDPTAEDKPVTALMLGQLSADDEAHERRLGRLDERVNDHDRRINDHDVRLGKVEERRRSE